MELLIGSALLGILCGVLVAEFYGWLPKVNRWLVSAAASRLPLPERERRNEEWLAHLAEIPNGVGALLYCVGLQMAAVRMSPPVIRKRIHGLVGSLRSSGAAKSAFERAVAAFLLLALAPPMMATAIAIKLENPSRPVIVRRPHDRNKQVIELKFRTHSFDKSEESPPADYIFRATRLGRFLRLTNLDKLPNLFNVLKGEMSLVESEDQDHNS